jgi:membrane protease subunit HflK
MPQDFPGWPPRRPQNDPIAELGELWEQVKGVFARGGGGDGGRVASGRRLNPFVIALVLLLLWGASGIYTVAPDERGVVLRFGRVARETGPGPHYRLPWPIEQVLTPSVTNIRKEEIGFRTVEAGPPARYQEIDAEALMLTGDENIVKLEFIVQYKVRDDAEGTSAYLFNIRDPVGTMRAIAEASMREVIGRTDIDKALTEGKEEIQVAAQQELQRILDAYAAGIDVVTVQLQDVDPPDQVSDAFKDVISAQQDKERLINEAYGYANDAVPKARGEAAQLVNEAEGHREGTVREATGAAQRFTALQTEFAKAPAVTRRRLYLETMEAILPGVTKIVLDEAAARQVVPYLPLDQLLKPRALEPAPKSGGQTQ